MLNKCFGKLEQRDDHDKVQNAHTEHIRHCGVPQNCAVASAI